MFASFYTAGVNAALTKLGIDFMADGFGNDSRAGLTVGDASGHQEAVEENDPRPRRMHPSTVSNYPRTSSDPSETVSRAFDSHDAIAPRETGRPHTEYVG